MQVQLGEVQSEPEKARGVGEERREDGGRWWRRQRTKRRRWKRWRLRRQRRKRRVETYICIGKCVPTPASLLRAFPLALSSGPDLFHSPCVPSPALRARVPHRSSVIPLVLTREKLSPSRSCAPTPARSLAASLSLPSLSPSRFLRRRATAGRLRSFFFFFLSFFSTSPPFFLSTPPGRRVIFIICYLLRATHHRPLPSWPPPPCVRRGPPGKTGK